MAARGRGGNSRGRGKASLSFNVEQLGLGPNEVLPGPVLHPPLLFPPLEYKPAPVLNVPIYESQLQLKHNFLDYFTKSSAFIQLKTLKYENRQTAATDETKKSDVPFVTDWSFLPPELKPVMNKRRRKSGMSENLPKKVFKENTTNLTSWLDELEKKENNEETNEKESVDKEKKKEEDEQEGDQNDEFEEDDMDEEMDDGTDYNQNYFDNGEGYLDEEDDNLDDGPIY